MKPMLVTEHDAAQNQMDAQLAEIAACAANEEHGTDVVDEHASEVAALRECTEQRAQTTSDQERLCEAWINHATRIRNEMPVCLGGTPTPAETLAHVQAWDSFTEEELSAMETANTACSEATAAAEATVTRCDQIESDFDGSYCSHQRSCTLNRACHDHEVEIYVSIVE